MTSPGLGQSWAESEQLWSEDITGIYCNILDYRKAFDSVPHTPLIVKLVDTGLQLAWLTEMQQVVVDGASSHQVQVTSGVPQGSVLGPLLYINSITEHNLSPLSFPVFYVMTSYFIVHYQVLMIYSGYSRTLTYDPGLVR